MRVLLNAHPRNVPSKLDAHYSGLCEIVDTRGSLLTLRELDTQRDFTANPTQSAVRQSRVPPSHRRPLLALPHCLRGPRCSPTAAPLILPAPSTVHRQSASRVAQLNPAQSEPRSHARAIRDTFDVSPLSPFGLPAVLPQQPPRRSTVRRKKRRNTHAPVAQPLAPTAQSTQVPCPPPLINLRISAPPSPIPRVAPPPLPNRRAPSAIA